MKNIFKLGLLFLLTGIFSSCEKKLAEVIYEGGTNPVLTANRTDIPLSFATADEEAVKLSWTNPDYRFSTGVNSHDVAYQLEIDVAGANFSSPNKKVIGLSRINELSVKQSELNDYILNQLELPFGVPHQIEMRVVSTLTNGSVPLPSNTLAYTVTAYEIPPKVTPPELHLAFTSDKLFIIGNATPGGDATGWNNPVPGAQEFTKVSTTFYTIDVELNAGKSYLLIPVNGNWSYKYGGAGGANANNPIEFDFMYNGADIISPTVGGLYRIDVDFQRGKIKLTKL
jgi:hypothetical protein